MASSKEYLDFVLDQLKPLQAINYRQMMDEYILYYKEKIIGGIYDDRLLVKNIEAARNFCASSRLELPYDGAKPMILVENVDDSDFLCRLFEEMFKNLPAPKAKKPR